MASKAKEGSGARVPDRMKAAAIDRFGGPGEIKLRTLPVPQPGDGEVLIALHAAGVGEWDAAIRQGAWRPPGRTKFPLIPGIDGAGIVVAKGAHVRRFRIGDRVYAYQFGKRSGFYAEYAVADADNVAPVPPQLDFLQAGAAAANGLTALQGIDDALHLRRGQTILIFGATGSVGTLALQLAKRKQARVIATATGPDAPGSQGEPAPIPPWSMRGRTRWSSSSRPSLPKASTSLSCSPAATEWKYASSSSAAAVASPIPTGSSRRPAAAGRSAWCPMTASLGRANSARLGRAVAEAKLRVPIAAVWPLAKAREAHKRLERGHILGRMVLRMP